MKNRQDYFTELSDDAYQEYILQFVSRTFALTIPQLPAALRDVVSNAYLLCRIADTIEDDKHMSFEDKRHFSDMFVEVVSGNTPAEEFSEQLYPLLSAEATDAEHNLIANTPAVIRLTLAYNDRQRAALHRCVKIMTDGMVRYQEAETLDGVADLKDMGKYCYFVAGVVGEMLMELFCDYSKEMDQHRDEIQQLAISFGQGLQMTNILKDIWEDHERGACWLPRDIFKQYNFDIPNKSPEAINENFEQGLGDLIAVAREHLANALQYTLYIPAKEKGMRKFCLWALGMAVLTLDKINNHRDFTDSKQVKITRRTVKITILFTSLFAGNDTVLRFMFKLAARKLPKTETDVLASTVSYGTGY